METAKTHDERPFSAGVQIDKPRRLSFDFGCAILFYISVAAQLVLALVILTSKNSEIETFEGCPSGYTSSSQCYRGNQNVSDTRGCVTSDLCQEIMACASSAPSRSLGAADISPRALSESNNRNIPGDSWQFLEEHWYQPTVLFLMSFILASVWLFALKKITKAVVWGTIAADALLLVGIFVWFLVEGWGINWGCIVGVAAILAGSGFFYKKVNACAEMMHIAMNGLFDNMHVFSVCFAVQLVWAAFFALWIASLLGMHFVREVRPTSYGCEVVTARWIDSGALITFWMLEYYWVTFFIQNINTIVVTHTVAGWYFNEDGYRQFWTKALKWSCGPLAGGNAICAAIMGIGDYLMSKIGSVWHLLFALLNPFDWGFICCALCLKTIIQTYTKFGLIAQAYSGRPFCEAAPRAFQVLKQWLGEAVITDYLGKRIMSWCTYIVALLVTYIAWVWGCEAQNLTGDDIDPFYFILLIILWVYLLSYPFLGLIIMVLFEQYVGSGIDGDARGYLNAFFASLFMGCITYFVLNFLSQIVVNAMDVSLFCYAVERDIGEQQNDRFAAFYDSIKISVAAGVTEGSSTVVVGTATQASTMMVTVPEGVLPGQALQVAAPSGQQIVVTVPEGLEPGMEFGVTVPQERFAGRWDKGTISEDCTKIIWNDGKEDAAKVANGKITVRKAGRIYTGTLHGDQIQWNDNDVWQREQAPSPTTNVIGQPMKNTQATISDATENV